MTKIEQIKKKVAQEFLEKFCSPAGLNNYPEANTHDILCFIRSHQSELEKAVRKEIAAEINIFLDEYLNRVGASKDSPLMVDLRNKLKAETRYEYKNYNTKKRG